MQQRIALAPALANDRRILLTNKPFGALAPHSVSNSIVCFT